MSDTEPTPAPWHAWRRMKDYNIRSGDPTGPAPVVGTALREPDANLMVAAPDMLKALEVVLASAWSPLIDDYSREVYLSEAELEEILAAVRKAKGVGDE